MSRVKKRVLLISLATIIAMFGLFGFRFGKRIFPIVYDMMPARRRLYQDVRKKIRIVELGMTKGEVEQIMGSPISVVDSEFENKKREIWYFPDSRVTSDHSRCIFDKNTGKVVKVISGEYYLLD